MPRHRLSDGGLVGMPGGLCPACATEPWTRPSLQLDEAVPSFCPARASRWWVWCAAAKKLLHMSGELQIWLKLSEVKWGIPADSWGSGLGSVWAVSTLGPRQGVQHVPSSEAQNAWIFKSSIALFAASSFWYLDYEEWFINTILSQEKLQLLIIFSSCIAFSLLGNIFQFFTCKNYCLITVWAGGEGGVNTPDGAVALRLSMIPWQNVCLYLKSFHGYIFAIHLYIFQWICWRQKRAKKLTQKETL